MNDINDFLAIFECPACHKGDLGLEDGFLKCSKCGARYEVINGIPNLVVGGKAVAEEGDGEASFLKWDKYYADVKKVEEDEIGFGALCQEHLEIFKDLDLLRRMGPGEMILDVGCGRGYVTYGISKSGRVTVGVDFVLDALLFAKSKFEKEGLSGLFVRADMSNLPFKKGAFGFVYSLGVLEHLASMEVPVGEIFRVLNNGGYTFNVVPAISVSSLTYAQLWGSIPNLPVARDLFYWFHHKLLRARHCIYGYELNYLESQLKTIFRRAGFTVNDSAVFKITCPLYKLTNTFLKSLGKAIIGNRLFTRHIYIYSKKIASDDDVSRFSVVRKVF